MITVSITESELRANNACVDGIADFAKAFPDGITTPWSPLHAIWCRVVFGAFAVWAEDCRLIPRADLSGADLYGADLCGAYRVSTDPPVPGWTIVDGRMTRA